MSELVGAKDETVEMEKGTRYYIGGICRTTLDSIGESVLAPSGELPLITAAVAAVVWVTVVAMVVAAAVQAVAVAAAEQSGTLGVKMATTIAAHYITMCTRDQKHKILIYLYHIFCITC